MKIKKFNESLRDEIHSQVHSDWYDEPKVSKHSNEHKDKITTYLDEIRDAINGIDDTSKLQDIEQILSSIIHKHI